MATHITSLTSQKCHIWSHPIIVQALCHQMYLYTCASSFIRVQSFSATHVLPHIRHNKNLPSTMREVVVISYIHDNIHSMIVATI